MTIWPARIAYCTGVDLSGLKKKKNKGPAADRQGRAARAIYFQVVPVGEQSAFDVDKFLQYRHTLGKILPKWSQSDNLTAIIATAMAGLR